MLDMLGAAGTTRDEHFEVCIVLQNLVEIDAVDSII